MCSIAADSCIPSVKKRGLSSNNGSVMKPRLRVPKMYQQTNSSSPAVVRPLSYGFLEVLHGSCFSPEYLLPGMTSRKQLGNSELPVAETQEKHSVRLQGAQRITPKQESC